MIAALAFLAVATTGAYAVVVIGCLLACWTMKDR